MKHLLLGLTVMCCISFQADAQQRNRRGQPQAKDSLKLSCLLLHAKELKEEQTMDLGVPEPKLRVSSETDTLVKAVTEMTVTTVQRGVDGTWEIVCFKDDYWFWHSGITKATVKKNQKLRAGDTLGVQEAGKPVELLVYDFETPLDAKKYMSCEN